MPETFYRDYDDLYPTCRETYSTLRIFSDSISPDQITEALGIQPTKAFRKDEPFSKGKLKRKTNGWFYSTKKLIDSRDTRRHLDMILNVSMARRIKSRVCKPRDARYRSRATGYPLDKAARG